MNIKLNLKEKRIGQEKPLYSDLNHDLSIYMQVCPASGVQLGLGFSLEA